MLHTGTLNNLVLFLSDKTDSTLYVLYVRQIFFNQSLGFFIKTFYIHQCFAVFCLFIFHLIIK